MKSYLNTWYSSRWHVVPATQHCSPVGTHCALHSAALSWTHLLWACIVGCTALVHCSGHTLRTAQCWSGCRHTSLATRCWSVAGTCHAPHNAGQSWTRVAHPTTLVHCWNASHNPLRLSVAGMCRAPHNAGPLYLFLFVFILCLKLITKPK